jgi:hypothetical protein
MEVRRLLQFPVTPGLVHVNVFPPAFPDTAKVPVQAPPVVLVALKVNVPEKLVAVVVPETVPFAARSPLSAQVPVNCLPG